MTDQASAHPAHDSAGAGPPGIDLVRIRRHLSAVLDHGPAGPLAASVIAGGRSNVTYKVTDGRATWVVRRPPLGGVLATAHDVGRAINPLSLTGQIEGGIAQGLGLAVMEEIIQIDGVIRNGNFTDYLLPTFLDMPDVVATLVEEPDPHAPLGAKGVGEPPCVSSTPAIVNAIRDALRQIDGVGKPLDRVPVRPSDICL